MRLKFQATGSYPLLVKGLSVTDIFGFLQFVRAGCSAFSSRVKWPSLSVGPRESGTQGNAVGLATRLDSRLIPACAGMSGSSDRDLNQLAALAQN
jgi:hypothetical protein